jgi:hypothetical protein
MISPRPKGSGRDLLEHVTRLLSEQVPEETEPELLQGEPGQTLLEEFWLGRSSLTRSTLYQVAPATNHQPELPLPPSTGTGKAGPFAEGTGT